MSLSRLNFLRTAGFTITPDKKVVRAQTHIRQSECTCQFLLVLLCLPCLPSLLLIHHSGIRINLVNNNNNNYHYHFIRS